MLVICLDWLLFHPHLDICSYSSYIYFTTLSNQEQDFKCEYVRDWHFKCLGVMLYVSVPKV